MKRILNIILFFSLYLTLFGLTFQHQAPQSYEPKTNVDITLEIIDGIESIKNIELCFGPLGSSTFMSKKMESILEGTAFYRVELTSVELQNKDLRYWFQFELHSGETVFYPDMGLNQEPFFLKAVASPEAEGSAGSDDWVDFSEHETDWPASDYEELNPGLAGFVLLTTNDYGPQEGEYVLAVAYHDIADRIMPGSIVVWVNGKDVTSKALVTENLLSYRDAWPIKEVYSARITAKDKFGNELTSKIFVTDVENKVKKSLPHLRGSLNYAADFHNPDSESNSYAGWADVHASYKKLNLSLHGYHHSREDNNRQPVDRYSLAFSLPSLDLRAGDVTPYFSPLAFGGKNIRGWYGSLYGEHISLELTSGTMTRKTVSGGNHEYSTAFQQKAQGGKLRLGPLRGLSMSFTLAQNRDEIASLDSLDFMRVDSVSGDTLFVVTPKDNLVAAFDTQVNIPQLKTSFGAEIASSLYNSNIWQGPMTSDEISDYIGGFDLIDPADIENLFIVNRNMEPLIPGLHNSAGRAWLRSTIGNHSLDMNANFTGPAYRALGTWGQQQDTQTFAVSDLYHLGRGFLLSGSYNWQKDNLLSTRSETNLQKNWNFQASLRLLKYFTLRGGMFSSNVSNRANPAFSDMSFDPFIRKSASSNFGVGFNNPKLNWLPWMIELNTRRGRSYTCRSLAPDNPENRNESVNFNLASKFGKIPLRFQAAVSHAFSSEYDSCVTVETKSKGWQTRFSYSLFREKLLPWLQYRHATTTGACQSEQRSQLSIGLDAYPWSKLTLGTALGFENTSFSNNPEQNTKSLNWSLTLGQRF
ncbi:MAG: hypothetical protein WCY21_01425 [Candidatus Cloacimonadaceae bacterium]|jgi:hypothetical protein|nr:hypothetical protein [Candidatus Cloacimonadota bacterium]MDX9949066.1 hypothetical protein [Candidatus Syntrophosphaera sp.]NLN84752.1 hypothetical protein [Candidatus Cloacimonadota bacterium]